MNLNYAIRVLRNDLREHKRLHADTNDHIAAVRERGERKHTLRECGCIQHEALYRKRVESLESAIAVLRKDGDK